MKIKRYPEQSEDSLEDFYRQISDNKAYDRTEVGKAMLQLLDALSEVFEQTQIWGVTSHARLVLLDDSGMPSGGHVTISSPGFTFYTIEYLLPIAKQPWQNAQVTGGVDTLEKAIDYVLIAMRESEGWIGNKELTRLLAERNL
jgi:hypothetical protein